MFVYDEAHLRARCQQAVAAFGHQQVVYATKAFLCKAMARLVYDEGLSARRCVGWRTGRRTGCRCARQRVHIARQQQVDEGTTRGDRGRSDGTSSSTRSTNSTASTHSLRNSWDRFRRCCCGSRRACRRTRTNSSRPVRTTRSLASTSATAMRCRAVDRARRSTSVELVGVHCHIGSNVFEASSFARRPQR